VSDLDQEGRALDRQSAAIAFERGSIEGDGQRLDRQSEHSRRTESAACPSCLALSMDRAGLSTDRAAPSTDRAIAIDRQSRALDRQSDRHRPTEPRPSTDRANTLDRDSAVSSRDSAKCSI
jgi:hypothetical protein